MNYLSNSYKKYNKIYNTIFIIISTSLTIGLILSTQLNNNIINNIYNIFIDNIKNYNNSFISTIIYPIITYSIILILSLTIIGSIIPFIVLFLENMSVGLLIGILIKKRALKGIIFSITYFTLSKLIYILILLYLTINIYKYIKNIITSIKTKSNNSIYSIYSKLLIKYLLCIIIITIYNILFIFITPKILNIFHFI